MRRSAWTVTWTELPRTENGQTLEYRVVETLADGLTEDEHVTIIYPEKGITGSTADKTYTVTNIPLGQITVTKKGEDGGLPNVEFTLTGKMARATSGPPVPTAQQPLLDCPSTIQVERRSPTP